ncbi:hypothetical protein [Halodurantibacterium flavum]|uniref:DUF1440 domain-containing protein n=1 Tax=Halodurantibacterium flavum TaxID=1382802 RepID=A0ABW4S1U6_9RHOB
MQRLVFGAVAGFSATMAMTAAMRHLFHHLDRNDRYPLPPREINQELFPHGGRALPALTVLSHFGYGAAAGALYALLPRRKSPGALYGVAVWAASYFGWVPGFRILRPASRHPPRRDILMIAAHLVWGLALSAGLRELDRSAEDVFAAGDARDAWDE